MKENNTIDQEDKEFEEFKRNVDRLMGLGPVDDDIIDDYYLLDEGGNYIPQLYDFDGDILDLIKRPHDPRYQ